MFAKYNLGVTYNVIVVAKQRQQNKQNNKQIKRWKIFDVKQQQQYCGGQQQRLKTDALTQNAFAVAKRYVEAVFALDVSAQFCFAALITHNVHFDNKPVGVHSLKRARLAARMKFKLVASGGGYVGKIMCQNRCTRFFHFYFVHFYYVNVALQLVSVKPLVQIF